MNKRIEAGLKGGGAAWICTYIAVMIDFTIVEVIAFPLVEMAAFSTAGILAVHFGRNALKNGKDVAVSSLIAGMISTFPPVFFFVLPTYSLLKVSIFGYDPWMFAGYILGVFIGTVLLAAVPSLAGGMVYAKYLGIPIRGQKKPIPKIQPTPIQAVYCPHCGNKIDRNWVSCPYCGYDLKDKTRTYDDDTQIY